MRNFLLILALIFNCFIAYGITYFIGTRVIFFSTMSNGIIIWLLLSLFDVCVYDFILIRDYKSVAELNGSLSHMRLKQVTKLNEKSSHF